MMRIFRQRNSNKNEAIIMIIIMKLKYGNRFHNYFGDDNEQYEAIVS